jgi:hypothetical protein
MRQVAPGVSEGPSVGYDLSFLQPFRSRLPSLLPSDRGSDRGDSDDGRSSDVSKDDQAAPHTPTRKPKGRYNSADSNDRGSFLGADSLRDSAFFGTATDTRRLSNHNAL